MSLTDAAQKLTDLDLGAGSEPELLVSISEAVCTDGCSYPSARMGGPGADLAGAARRHPDRPATATWPAFPFGGPLTC